MGNSLALYTIQSLINCKKQHDKFSQLRNQYLEVVIGQGDDSGDVLL